jgi:hypothetical protein
MSIALLCFATLTALAESAEISRVTQGIDESKLVMLKGHVTPIATAKNDRGPVEDSFDIDHMHLVLQRSAAQEQELNQLMEEQNDKNSPNFHKWLSAAEFGEQFGVSQQDIDAVTGWLESHGFHVNQVYANHMMIDFGGNAGQLREAFHTPIHNIEFKGEPHISNMSNPQIPAALAPVIKGIASLNDIKPKAMHEPKYTFAGCSDASPILTEPGTCYGITPQDNQTIYNLNPLYNAGISGQGQTIYLVEDTDTYGTAGSNGASDWNTYRSTFGLSSAFPLGSYSQTHPGGCTDPGINGDDGEAAIDVEVASAVAPSAAIQLISCPSVVFTFGGQIALQNLINQNNPTLGVVSVSYGLCEAFTGQGGNAAFYNTYQQAAAEGFSVFVSSGDEGPSSCSNLFSVGSEYDVATLGVTGWGETPFNVTVGGTDFEDTYMAKKEGIPQSTYWSATNTAGFGSALSYIPEIPWNDACASVLISEVITGSFVPYGASPAACNNATFDTTSAYLSTGAASGGASNCAIGAGGADQGGDGDTVSECQGYPKPSWQSGASLPGGVAVYGVPADGVRDIPDVAMFAANGVWGHFEVVCWSDPAETAGGSTPCTAGQPDTWAGFGGTSVASPTMAAVQALINQKTGEFWGNPNPIYYQIAQSQYGTAGGSFLGSACNSSTGNPGACAFNDITLGDIDLACEDNGTLTESHCFKPTGTHGVDSTDNVTAAAVINGGSGYTTAPTCTIAGPTNANPYLSPTGTTLWAGGTQAKCTATVNAGTTNAVWTVKVAAAPGANWVSGVTGFTVGGTTYTFFSSLAGVTTPNAVLYVSTGSSSAQETDAAKNLEAAVNDNSAQCTTAPCFANITAANTFATATETTSTTTLTAKTAGYAGTFNVAWGNGFIEGPDLVTITNTTIGQGPNFVSGITIGTAGSGYQPDTPITLTGVGSGAIAIANTSVGTAAQSYQPTYGAGSGYDLATGLGSPNASSLVCSSAWGISLQSISWSQQGPYTYGQSPVALTGIASSGLTIAYTVVSGPGTINNGTLTITGAGTIVIDANQFGNNAYCAATQVQQSIVVNRANLTVTANPVNMIQGSAVPPLTYSITGFVNSDTSSVVSGSATLTTTATSSSFPGTFPITFSTEALTAANYTFTYVNGTLSVTAAPAVSLSVTSAVTGSHSGGYILKITVTNTGAGTVTNATLSTATLGSTSGTPLPQNLGSIAPGNSVTFSLMFPGSIGADGAGVAEKYSGTVTGGSFSGSIRSVTLP